MEGKKVVVILGPTGSGKTAVGVELAKKINGEIISADSRAIYKDMNIGTAKPSMAEREGVPHFGFDLVEPGERFTVADFKEYAEGKIQEIFKREHQPIIVGGTGLYLDALYYNYQFGVKDERDRKEVCTNYLLVGVRTEREELRKRLEMRVNKIFTQELFDEVENLEKKYGEKAFNLKADIYQFARAYMKGEMNLEEAKTKTFYQDWHLARRQMTWFRRTPEINWIEPSKICSFVIKYL